MQGKVKLSNDVRLARPGALDMAKGKAAKRYVDSYTVKGTSKVVRRMSLCAAIILCS